MPTSAARASTTSPSASAAPIPRATCWWRAAWRSSTVRWSARISTISYGKDRPAALGSDEQAWAQNRRAVTVVR